MEERVKSLEEETKSIHGGLVGLQFQAEKEEAVKTLVSRMDGIDAERQQSVARATEQQKPGTGPGPRSRSAIQQQTALQQPTMSTTAKAKFAKAIIG